MDDKVHIRKVVHNLLLDAFNGRWNVREVEDSLHSRIFLENKTIILHCQHELASRVLPVCIAFTSSLQRVSLMLITLIVTITNVQCNFFRLGTSSGFMFL